MAWTTPRTWQVEEVVTAALMNTHVRDNLNVLAERDSAFDADSDVFTNTSFADLDALTGDAGNFSPLIVTVATGTTALVTISARLANNTLGAITFLGVDISGATTLAASDNLSLFYEASAANDTVQMSYTHLYTGLTPGSNVFELEARVNSGTGTIGRPELIVEAWPV